jgi:ADP-heptose:LPS heptosyltransferase
MHPELWENNPHLTPLREDKGTVEVIDCECPLIDLANQRPHHYREGFIDFLNKRVGIHVELTAFKGDLHLSFAEKANLPGVGDMKRNDDTFWILVAGGKRDFTIKWWDAHRYQEVVDHFRGRIQFVQIGAEGAYHPRIDGAIDLRGKTSLRQLIQLVYHSQGVLCPVTFVMHLAAAVEMKYNHPRNRPCVVVAGGREPPHWEAYPHHQFIHTVGALRCCERGGCWRYRTVALGDGEFYDRAEFLCVDVVNGLPRCMDMVSAEDVIRRIEMYFQGGALAYSAALQSA